MPPAPSRRFRRTSAGASAALTRADASASSPTPDKPAPKRDRPARGYRVPWADLLKKVFAVDVLVTASLGLFRERIEGWRGAPQSVSSHAFAGRRFNPRSWGPIIYLTVTYGN